MRYLVSGSHETIRQELESQEIIREIMGKAIFTFPLQIKKQVNLTPAGHPRAQGGAPGLWQASGQGWLHHSATPNPAPALAP